MDPLSLTVSISSLLVFAARVIKTSCDLRTRYKEAAFMLSAVSTECTVINASLAMLQNLMLGNIDDLQSRMVPEVLATFDTALQGCCLTLSVIEEELKSLLVCEEKGDVVPKRLKYILEKEHLKELLLQLRGQQSGVSLLLQMYQAGSNATMHKITEDNNMLLRQIANRGRSFYLESINDRNDSSIDCSSDDTVSSLRDTSSTINERRFAFDDELVNAAVYQRALASFKQHHLSDNETIRDNDSVQSQPVAIPSPLVVIDAGAQEALELKSDQRAWANIVPSVPTWEPNSVSSRTSNSDSIDHSPRDPDSSQDQLASTKAMASPHVSAEADLRTADVLHTEELQRTKRLLGSCREALDIETYSYTQPAREDDCMKLQTVYAKMRSFSTPSDNTKYDLGISTDLSHNHDSENYIRNPRAGTAEREENHISDSKRSVDSNSQDVVAAANADMALAAKTNEKHWSADERATVHLKYMQSLTKRAKKDLKDMRIPTKAKKTTIYLQCVVVGDGYVGKSHTLVYSKGGIFANVLGPTVSETYSAGISVNNLAIDMLFNDTSGMEDHDRLRPLSYPDSHVCLMCFALDDYGSLDNILEKWISEVHHFLPNVPYILLGCKSDTRTDPESVKRRYERSPVTEQQGREMSEKIGAWSYMECSARTGDGMQEVFETAAWAALSFKYAKRRRHERLKLEKMGLSR